MARLIPLFVAAILISLGTRAAAEEPDIDYGLGGLTVQSADGNFKLNLVLRAQLRYSDPFDGAPTLPAQLDSIVAQSTFGINRARIKIGGHAYRPWMKYYWEYDLPGSALLDLRMTLVAREGLRVRVGQWKAEYSRERVDSSGRQQLVDRSIVNRIFTIDRQAGVELQGRLFPERAGDLNYWLGVFTGGGRGGVNDDEHHMYLGRLQWNFLGTPVAFSQCDLKRTGPRVSVAVAAVTNQSRYTRFDSSGGGQLDGFEDGKPGQYRVNQGLAELAFKWRGFSLQHEYHRKWIKDRVNDTETRLEGAYVQAGYFFHEAWSAFPQPLELAARFAFVDPDRDLADDKEFEYTLGANWFFAGHDNKLTADIALIRFDTPDGDREAEPRFRLQWDVSI